MQDQDITELAKHITELKQAWENLPYDKHQPIYTDANYERVRARRIYEDEALQAAPKLAQAVLAIPELEAINHELADSYTKALEEIAALRPDAQAWREREARIERERQELRERMRR